MLYWNMTEENPCLELKEDREAAGPEFTLIQRGDSVVPGLWNWRCRRELGPDNVALWFCAGRRAGKRIIVQAKTFENGPQLIPRPRRSGGVLI